MTWLTVVTSGPEGSLALFNTNDPSSVAQVHWQKKAMHSELATVKLQELLGAASTDLKSITHIAVNLGPGSFTGIRVGINMARTLAYGLGLPVATFDTLSVLAFKHSRPGHRVFVALKAVQSFYYAAAFEVKENGLTEILAPCSLDQSELQKHSQSCTNVFIEGQTANFTPSITAIDLVQWLSKWPESKLFFAWKDVKPLYIRGSEAEEKLRKGLLKPL